MSCTATGLPYGQANITGITLTAIPGHFNYGTPATSAYQAQGIYQTQVAGANGTLRWLRDEATPGTASRTTWVDAGA